MTLPITLPRFGAVSFQKSDLNNPVAVHVKPQELAAFAIFPDQLTLDMVSGSDCLAVYADGEDAVAYRKAMGRLSGVSRCTLEKVFNDERLLEIQAAAEQVFAKLAEQFPTFGPTSNPEQTSLEAAQAQV